MTGPFWFDATAVPITPTVFDDVVSSALSARLTEAWSPFPPKRYTTVPDASVVASALRTYETTGV